MSGLASLTGIHTLISLVAVVLGIVAVAGLFRPAPPERWTTWFLVAAILTSATGFLFPFIGVTPAFATGIVAGVVLALVLVARYGYHLAGRWRAVYTVGLVISLYLLVFVTIAQAFDKIPALNALAPTGSEPAFAAAQLVCLAVFAVIGFRAVRGPGGRLAA